MAALVENMFYVGREVPWHGLGVQLNNPPTSKEAIVAAGLDWEVIPKPIFNESGVQIPNYVANVRSSDDSVLGIVTNRYTIVQNAEAFDFTDSLVNVEGGMKFETAGSLRDGKQIWLLGKMPKTTILGDDVEPYICFTNTHDGTGAVRVCMTPVRVVCNNTLNLALDTAKRSWSTRHIGDINGKVREAQATLGLVDAYMSSLKTECEKLADVKVSDAEVEALFDMLYPVNEMTTDITKKRIEITKEAFFKCLQAEDMKKFKGTGYGAIMAITDHADHSAPMRKTQNFEQNRWGSIIVGHPFVDAMYKGLKKIVAA